jgi:hypothetical protein
VDQESRTAPGLSKNFGSGTGFTELAGSGLISALDVVGGNMVTGFATTGFVEREEVGHGCPIVGKAGCTGTDWIADPAHGQHADAAIGTMGRTVPTASGADVSVDTTGAA